MSKTQNPAETLINGLLEEAKANPDFEQWKKDHPEQAAKATAMTREEMIAEIITALDKLGFVKHDEEQPEPEQELTAEELQAEYGNMTDEEQRGFIEYCVFVEGFKKALQEIPEGIHERYTELIRERFNVKKQAPIYLMIMGYAAGVNHGFDIACKVTGAEEEQKPTRPTTRAEKTARILSILEEFGIIDPITPKEAGGAEQ